MASASFKLDKLPFRIEEASLEELSAQPGIGKSTAEKAKEVAATGTFKELEDLIENTPSSRIGKPEDIAKAAYFLASDDASYINGQILPVNGGFVI